MKTKAMKPVKKTTKTAKIPVEVVDLLVRQEGRSVGIDMDLGHFPIFSCGEKRNFGNIERFFPGGKWLLSGVEHPNYRDLDIYLAVLKMFEVAEANGSLIVKDLVDRIEISGAQLLNYCGLSRNGTNLKRVLYSLTVLNRFVAERYQTFDIENKKGERAGKVSGKVWSNQKELRIKSFKLLTLPDVVVRNGDIEKIVIDITKTVREMSQKMHVHWRDLQNLTSQWEKGIYLYFEANSAKWIRQDWLLRFLGVAEAPEKPADNAEPVLMIDYEKKAAAHKTYMYSVVREIKDALISLGEKGNIRKFDIKKHIYKTKSNRVVYLVQKPVNAEQAESEKVASKAAWIKKETKQKGSKKPSISSLIADSVTTLNFSDIPL